MIRIVITNHGSVVGFTSTTQDARNFLASIGAEPWQFLGPTMVLDHRVARDFIDHALEDGVEFTGLDRLMC